MQDAISAYRASYRYTIIELPSLKHADACAVALMLDAFVLVVEARRTGTSDLLQSLSMAQPVADRLIGVVVNKAS